MEGIFDQLMDDMKNYALYYVGKSLVLVTYFCNLYNVILQITELLSYYIILLH